jgi:hypothetical protein
MNIQGNIIAKSIIGSRVALIVENAGLYTALLFHVKKSFLGSKATLVAKRQLTTDEVSALESGSAGSTLMGSVAGFSSTLQLNGHVSETAEAATPAQNTCQNICEVLYLPSPVSPKIQSLPLAKVYNSFKTPYFSISDIILSVQKPRAPSYR